VKRSPSKGQSKEAKAKEAQPKEGLLVSLLFLIEQS
jgi:hypothetical protein